MKQLCFFLLIMTLVGCFRRPEWRYRPYKPVYMSYEELRSAVKLEAPREIGKRGKIYLYENLLMINEPNKGVHIFDNTDAANPIALGFINVPGNIDIAVRDGVVYLDSFIDLVAITLSLPDSVTVKKRITEMFEYDPYQALDNPDIYFEYYEIEKGVVVGYE